MKTVKIGIASYSEMKARTLAITKGELKPQASAPMIWFTSPKSFAQLLSNRNREPLDVITDTLVAFLRGSRTSFGKTEFLVA